MRRPNTDNDMAVYGSVFIVSSMFVYLVLYVYVFFTPLRILNADLMVGIFERA